MKMRKKVTKETRSKLRKASLERRLKFGYINSPETRRKLSEINKGKKHSKDTIEKLRKIHSNRSKETRRRMSISQKGKKQSKETIRKRVIARKDYKHSEETIEKIREAHKGIRHSEQTKQKLSEMTKGKRHSEKTKQKMSETQKRIENIPPHPTGEDHPNWKGGKSFEPYTPDFNGKFKEKIRERDGYTCKLCNLFEEDHIKLYESRLYIHHIDYIKLNTFPQNCIALCLRCNLLVNKDRELWTKHFQELLKKLYNYEYTQDQKIILDFTKKW